MLTGGFRPGKMTMVVVKDTPLEVEVGSMFGVNILVKYVSGRLRLPREFFFFRGSNIAY